MKDMTMSDKDKNSFFATMRKGVFWYNREEALRIFRVFADNARFPGLISSLVAIGDAGVFCEVICAYSSSFKRDDFKCMFSEKTFPKGLGRLLAAEPGVEVDIIKLKGELELKNKKQLSPEQVPEACKIRDQLIYSLSNSRRHSENLNIKFLKAAKIIQNVFPQLLSPKDIIEALVDGMENVPDDMWRTRGINHVAKVGGAQLARHTVRLLADKSVPVNISYLIKFFEDKLMKDGIKDVILNNFKDSPSTMGEMISYSLKHFQGSDLDAELERIYDMAFSPENLQRVIYSEDFGIFFNKVASIGESRSVKKKMVAALVDVVTHSTLRSFNRYWSLFFMNYSAAGGVTRKVAAEYICDLLLQRLDDPTFYGNFDLSHLLQMVPVNLTFKIIEKMIDVDPHFVARNFIIPDFIIKLRYMMRWDKDDSQSNLNALVEAMTGKQQIGTIENAVVGIIGICIERDPDILNELLSILRQRIFHLKKCRQSETRFRYLEYKHNHKKRENVISRYRSIEIEIFQLLEKLAIKMGDIKVLRKMFRNYFEILDHDFFDDVSIEVSGERKKLIDVVLSEGVELKFNSVSIDSW